MSHTPASSFSARVPGQRLLHAPGPTPVPDEVLHALTRQPLDHGDPRLDDCIAHCEEGLKRIVGAPDAQVVMFVANGHGAWETVIENLLGPEDLALIPGTGHFSEQWALQAEGVGRQVLRTPWREGEVLDIEAVAAALRDDTAHRIKAVFAVQTDTASGITNDLAALRAAIDATGHPALFVVDAVASLGAMPLSMPELRADVVLGASQKGLMCPPGLAFVIINQRAAQAAQANPAPRLYWSWERRLGDASYVKFNGTPPHNLLFALEASLGLLFSEGLDAVYARHRANARAVWAAVEGWREGGALEFLARDPASRSVSVTTIAVRPGVEIEPLRRVARDRFQVAMAGGLGPMTGRAFRIGHLGDQNAAMILGALGGIEAALRVQGVPVGPGMQRAVQAFADGEAP